MFTIDPHKITDYNRDGKQKQAFLLFAIIAAGKNSKVQSEKLADFLYPAIVAGISPFELINQLNSVGMLDHSLRFNKMGQYNRITRAFTECVELDLEVCTAEDLEAIKGIGPKTARFFLLHTRKYEQYAVLDTHILRWMREELGIPTPKNTPSGKRYHDLEGDYLNYCIMNDEDPADLDLRIWSRYNRPNMESGER